jgi:tellurite resistance protein TerC
LRQDEPSARKDMVELFPFSEYWWFYLSFVGLVLLLLALDLGVFHRKAHAVGFREAATWTVVWIALSLIFNSLLYNYALWKFPQDPRLWRYPVLIRRRGVACVARVSHRLRDREVALGRQHLRLRDGVLVLRNSCEVPASSVVLRHSRRADLSRDLCRAWRGADAVSLGGDRVWCVSDLHGFKIFFAKEKEFDPEKNFLIRLLRRVIPVTPDAPGSEVLFPTGEWQNVCDAAARRAHFSRGH